ncbi:MAG: hypothetical protein IPJ32_21445 [Sphingobacteriaceae bacterium]|nr:hypothetical protein [Sphingobacteriaceae bacterium]
MYCSSNFIKDSLDTYINREMETVEFTGHCYCYCKRWKVIVSKGYGVADVSGTHQ